MISRKSSVVLFAVALAVLMLRGMLYPLSDNPYWLVSVQLLDGVGAGIFGALFPLVVADLSAGDPELEAMAGGAGSSIGRGGMITKILAAKRAAGSGASTVIAWGREPDALLRLARGEAIGTQLVAQTAKHQARKRWMADHLQLRGAVTVDAGAAAKVRAEGKSLLPIGMTGVEGEFTRGDVIAVRDPSGVELARGLANYSSAEARLLCRKPSSEFERLLGYVAEPEMVHRDNLILMVAAG